MIRGFIHILLFVAAPAVAQTIQPARYEKDEKDLEDLHLISLGDEGVVLIQDLEKYHAGKKVWQVVQLDTTLTTKQTIPVETESYYLFIGYEYLPGQLYLLYQKGETYKNEYELIHILLTTGEISRYQIKPELDLKLSYFSAVGSSVLFGGYVTKEPAIMLFKPKENTMKIVPGFFQHDTEFIDLRPNQNQTFNVVLAEGYTKEKRKLVFKTFDENGELLLEDNVDIESKKILKTGITSTLIREDLIVAGTWSEGNNRQSHGIYLFTINPFHENKIQYVLLPELDHFLDYMKPKQANKIRKKSLKDSDAGRIPSYSSYLMPFKISEHKNGFCLFAEAYTPLTNVNSYPGSYYGTPYYNPYAMYPYFPGYSFGRGYPPYSIGNPANAAQEIETKESILVFFDSTGQLTWDQSIVPDDLKSAALIQMADFYYSGDKTVFLYKKEAEVKIKKITADGTMTESSEKINTRQEGDEIRSDKKTEGGVRHWYKNVFYAWGYQTVKNTIQKDRIRDVFYINKIVIR